MSMIVIQCPLSRESSLFHYSNFHAATPQHFSRLVKYLHYPIILVKNKIALDAIKAWVCERIFSSSQAKTLISIADSRKELL